MIKVQELSDPNSCMSRAHDDEMTFVLLGRDIAAPFAVMAWCQSRILLGKNKADDPQLIEAQQCAMRMVEQAGAAGLMPSEIMLLIGMAAFTEVAHSNSARKGFWDGTRLPDMPVETMASKIALMHSELSEMLEGVRKPGPDSHCMQYTSEEIELADLMIRAADYAEARQLRLGHAIVAKMRFNASRPHKHGKAI